MGLLVSAAGLEGWQDSHRARPRWVACPDNCGGRHPQVARRGRSRKGQLPRPPLSVFPRFVPSCYGLEVHQHLCALLDREIDVKEGELNASDWRGKRAAELLDRIEPIPRSAQGSKRPLEPSARTYIFVIDNGFKTV